MAQETIVRYIDDTDGSDAVGPVKFSFQGLDDSKPKHYVIDLNAKNGQAIAESFAEWIAAARRDTDGDTAPKGRKASSGSRPVSNREQTQAIREWARQQGHQISERGRVPKTIVEAFEAAH